MQTPPCLHGRRAAYVSDEQERLGMEIKMKYLVSAAEMKEYDENTIEKIGIPALVLMERAALQAFGRIEKFLQNCRQTEKTALVMAGHGNNGGDGLALARLLAERGIAVEVWCVGSEERATVQWKTQKKILEHYPVEYSTKPSRAEYTIVIDALFGVGLSGEIVGEFRAALERFEQVKGFKLALDIPSGIDADTGKIWGIAAGVDETVTFGFCKRGLVLYPGCELAGTVTTVPIGISEAAFFGREPEWFTYEESLCELLPGRERAGNKGTFGKLLLIAGSKNMAGAALLAAKAAYRAGAGMVKVVTPEENRVIVQETAPEALLETDMDITRDLCRWADVAVIGPGLGKDERALSLLRQAVENSRIPLLIDADGLNLLAENPGLMTALERQKREGRKLVLTPHMGELSRLTGKSISELKENPAEAGRKLAAALHAVVAAKDARTFVCRERGSVFVNLTGNSGMATAGSGDVLAGIIGGLIAQRMEPFEAACVGVYLHGKAGDRVSETFGEHGCMAGDIAEMTGRLTANKE